MDIIASHQQGLIESIEQEAVALAGVPGGGAQRAIVCHHVSDMLGQAHGYALLAAQGALDLEPAIEAMLTQARRSWARLRRDNRLALAARVAVFGEKLERIDAERCAGLLVAYRLVATPGLDGEAARRLDPALHAALKRAQSVRGKAGGDARRDLFLAHQAWAETLIGVALEQALVELEWPLGPRLVRRAVGALRIPIDAYERGERTNFRNIERRLRASRRLPVTFAANPAQAFFKLQRDAAERRRRMVGSPGTELEFAL